MTLILAVLVSIFQCAKCTFWYHFLDFFRIVAEVDYDIGHQIQTHGVAWVETHHQVSQDISSHHLPISWVSLFNTRATYVKTAFYSDNVTRLWILAIMSVAVTKVRSVKGFDLRSQILLVLSTGFASIDLCVPVPKYWGNCCQWLKNIVFPWTCISIYYRVDVSTQ